ncbi:hypothetical protein NLX83_09865 [Allokutzneria sp. A3M-2-11 16]|uniref:hypothetical protein n=1 Tax=Allokutzneria sp. A3M-2-11 16 TaxID=2962043 RepID=UPI0020B772A5|nr:hypothetical protein [Allokutzneria sp. A3M-2-11 16]MCP3799561.1 hypothetical protein [Allokutzneria sp. A3M-2-11 16]
MKKSRRGMRIALLGAGLAVVAPLLCATTASATDYAPTCVTWKTDYWKSRIEVTNNCSTTQRVKLVIKFAGDGDCKVYAPGQRHDHYSISSRVDRLERC